VLRPKEHIAIIGNTLAERLQYDGWLETMLHARFPKHELVVRNLGFSGDEIATRLRSRNFGTPDEWLRGHAAPVGGYQDNRLDGANTAVDVIFAFFGYNESYAGQEGLSAFRTQLDDWITHTLAQKYNGKSAPRIVLFSPIAHENLRAIGSARRRREQPEAGTVRARDGGGREDARRDVRRSVRAERSVVCVSERAPDDPGHSLEQRGESPHR
jgi:hypothetical protein